MTSRRAWLAWAAVVVPAWIAMVLCTHWEPVVRDGWGHFLWHSTHDSSFANLVDFAKGSYVHNNPRLGQVMTYLVFTPGPWHELVTPIVELSLFYLLTTLVLGRWPSARRTDDALLFATIFAMTAISSPQFGPMLFYRPFTGNYLFGLVVNLGFLVPYRLHAESPRRFGWWWIPIMLVLGFASGMCNEHTGPAIVALAGFAVVMFWRRGERFVPWAIAGITGMIGGGLALMFAPGQNIRYNALATQQSVLGRIAERGALGNTKVVLALLGTLLPLLVWLMLGLVARWRSRPSAALRGRTIAELAAVAASLAITLTLLASPKIGPRMYFASVAFACAAAGGWVVSQLATRWARATCAALAAIVLAFVGWRCLRIYSVVGPEFAARLDALQHAPANSVLELPVLSGTRGRWWIGDDLVLEDIRNHVAFSFSLALIKMTKTTGQHVDATPDDP